jgi:hypothetical protein
MCTKPWHNPDILGNILLHCNPDDVIRFRLVSVDWQNASDKSALWISLVKLQLIPRDFVDHVLTIRKEQDGSQNLTDHEKLLIGTVFNYHSVDNTGEKALVPALKRLALLWRTYNGLYLLDRFRSNNVFRDLRQNNAGAKWHIRWRLWVDDIDSIKFEEGNLLIQARLYNPKRSSSNPPHVTLILSKSASEQLREFIILNGDLSVYSLPLQKLVQVFFKEHAKRNDRFVMADFIQVRGTVDLNLLMQYSTTCFVQADSVQLVEALDPEDDNTAFLDANQSHGAIDSLINNALHGIDADNYEYDQR